MIPRAYITAWRNTVPWAEDAQIEQDLVLSRALVELFANKHIGDSLILRGGTALQKLLLKPAVRYSEDIDLVQKRAEPIGETINLIRSTLDSWLGTPKRNATKNGVTLVYQFTSEIPPTQSLKLKIEMNTREHFCVLPISKHPFEVINPWHSSFANISVYDMNELMGTKLRALYQRKKGRDLFDLAIALERKLIQPKIVVECFQQYMINEENKVSRAEFESNLHEKLIDPNFLSDIKPLICPSIQFEPDRYASSVQKELLTLLHGHPWKCISHYRA